MQDSTQDTKQLSPQDQAIRDFIDGIIAAKNASGLNEQVLGYLREDLSERLLDQIDRALLEALPEEKATELDVLLDNENITPEEVQRFIVDAGVDVPKITALTMVRFRDLYLEKTAE